MAVCISKSLFSVCLLHCSEDSHLCIRWCINNFDNIKMHGTNVGKKCKLCLKIQLLRRIGVPTLAGEWIILFYLATGGGGRVGGCFPEDEASEVVNLTISPYLFMT